MNPQNQLIFSSSTPSSSSMSHHGLSGIGPFSPQDPIMPSGFLPNNDDFSAHEPNVPQLVVSQLFIDNVAREFGLPAAQRPTYILVLRRVDFAGIRQRWTHQGHLSTRLFQMGLFMAHANESRRAAEQNNIENMPSFSMTFVSASMMDTPSPETNEEHPCSGQDIIYEPTRTSFMKMHLDVIQKLCDNKGTAKLTSVFGNPAREKILFPLVKRICSSVRNSFRQDIRNSICGDSPLLGRFTYTSAMKFKRGGPGISLDVGYSVHNAILKRKLSTQTQGGGRIPKGKDFWSQVDTFFTKKITEFGTKNLQNAGWKEYTKDTIRMDEIHFPALPDLEMDAELSSPSASNSARSQSSGVDTTEITRY
ncbi:hypothetical protein B0H13DRAFT_1920674 [Mycena leptocephala]|nr:hypothetical protein B0H13DRAFT_1920674 [Mycena leptocephala]